MMRSCILILIAFSSNVQASVSQKMDELMAAFNYQHALEHYDMHMIRSEYPSSLLKADSLLPQTANYPLSDLQTLYQFSQTCTGLLPMSPSLSEALVFTRALCRGTKLPETWFARSNLIHPGGGSYAARYIKLHPDQSETLQHYMHISEKAPVENALQQRLQSMTPNEINALISGAKIILQKRYVWIRKGEEYFVFPSSTLYSYAKHQNLGFELAEQSTTCSYLQGNICWYEMDGIESIKQLFVALILVNILLLMSLGVYRWRVRRRELKARMLILQILTHELRTPIASLSLTVEGFRREFERLPESVYSEFRRLCEDSRRLHQLADASKDYLQSDDQPLATAWLYSVNEWCEYKVQSYTKPVTYQINQDRAVKVNIYWLGTCIDNLVNNAVKYGVAPVSLNIVIEERKIRIEVLDQGTLTKNDWGKLKLPFVSKAGLGLGLTIVDAMAKRMGGKLSLSGPPTKFILEIPCETDIATR